MLAICQMKIINQVSILVRPRVDGIGPGPVYHSSRCLPQLPPARAAKIDKGVYILMK